MRRLRIAVLMDKDLIPPETIERVSDKEMAPWKTEYDVLVTLKEMGHHADVVGIGGDLSALSTACETLRPDIVFNLLEEFRGLRIHVPYVLGYLELTGLAYTGCGPNGMILAHSKALANRLLRAHRVRAPDFVMFERGRRVRHLRRLGFPLLVKSATEHGSQGISQASVVRDEAQLKDRVEFVHDQLQTSAVAEQYIEGREFYVGVIGNRRLQTFPIWELTFRNLPDNAPNIATAKVKWDQAYQEKSGVATQRAKDLPGDLEARIRRTCKRVYRTLGQNGYARIDLRLSPDGAVYVLECNPNPQLAYGEDFAESAESMGISYDKLLQRIVNLGLRYTTHPKE